MKKLIYLSTVSLLLLSCGGDRSTNVDDALESNNLEEIRASREVVHNQYEKLAADLARLDAAIDSLDPNKNHPLVKVVTLKDSTFTHYIELQGNVDTKQNILIYPEYSGILTQLNVKAGQKVTKGQVLARIDDAGMGAQVAQAEGQLALAKTTYERQKKLWDQKIGSEIQFLQAKTNMESQQETVAQLRAQLAKTIIRAPFTGTIDEVLTERGKVVSQGQELFRIVNLGDMYVTANVPETYISQLRVGASVEVYLNALGKTYTGKVRQIGNYINPNNRTFGIEVALPNPENLLRPNQVAVLKIEDYKNPKALLLPETVIQEKGNGKLIVYLAENEDNKVKAVQREVETGYTTGGVTEIKSGLQAGDKVITDGAKTVRDGLVVEILK